MSDSPKKIRILADSSSDLTGLDSMDFSSVPLTISANDIDYVDDENLDTHAMLDALMAYKGRSYTACPGVEQWMREFDGADEIYVATITSNLSGTYNAACTARDLYLQNHPDAKICIFDTLSTGPEMRLFVEKIASLVKQSLPFDEVCAKAKDYLKHTRLFFVLESLHCLAGRTAILLGSNGNKISPEATKTLPAPIAFRPLNWYNDKIVYLCILCTNIKNTYVTICRCSTWNIKSKLIIVNI